MSKMNHGLADVEANWLDAVTEIPAPRTSILVTAGRNGRHNMAPKAAAQSEKRSFAVEWGSDFNRDSEENSQQDGLPNS